MSKMRAKDKSTALPPPPPPPPCTKYLFVFISVKNAEIKTSSMFFN